MLFNTFSTTDVLACDIIVPVLLHGPGSNAFAVITVLTFLSELAVCGN